MRALYVALAVGLLAAVVATLGAAAGLAGVLLGLPVRGWMVWPVGALVALGCVGLALRHERRRG